MMDRREILFVAGAAASSLFVPLPALADAAAGSVVGLRGQCLIERQGHPSPLKMGDAVAVSDTIEVPADGKLKLRMSDGSVISLASGTKMTVAAYQTGAGGQRQNAQLSLGEGLLRAVVSPVDHPSTFEVSTAVGTAVSLTSSATGRAVTIPSRWGARLESGRDPVQARVWSPDEFQAVISRTDVP